MTRPLLRMPRWHHRLLWIVGLSLVLSGSAWLAVHYSIGAGADELPHPAELWLMRWHGAAAFGALFTLGVLSATHVQAGWRLTGGAPLRRQHRGWQRLTGSGLLVLAGLLVLSGYGMYYLVPEDWRPPVGWAHAITGLLALGLTLMHRRGHRPRGH